MSSSRPLALAAALLALAACATTTQTSSGRDYLAARPEWAALTGEPAIGNGGAWDGGAPGSVDRAVYAAASAEPLLRLPARLGLARVQNGALTGIPPEEAAAWTELVRQAGPAFGEFLPISPLLTEMAVSAHGQGAVRGVVDRVRIGAARQHTDAVLIYEVRGASTDAGTPLSVLDLTIVGAYLVPSRLVGGQAAATALLVDVRNGYPYGTATARAEENGIWMSVGSTDRGQALQRAAEAGAVRNLTQEVGTMMGRLRTELAARGPVSAIAPPPGAAPQLTRRASR